MKHFFLVRDEVFPRLADDKNNEGCFLYSGSGFISVVIDWFASLLADTLAPQIESLSALASTTAMHTKRRTLEAHTPSAVPSPSSISSSALSLTYVGSLARLLVSNSQIPHIFHSMVSNASLPSSYSKMVALSQSLYYRGHFMWVKEVSRLVFAEFEQGISSGAWRGFKECNSWMKVSMNSTKPASASSLSVASPSLTSSSSSASMLPKSVSYLHQNIPFAPSPYVTSTLALLVREVGRLGLSLDNNVLSLLKREVFLKCITVIDSVLPSLKEVNAEQGPLQLWFDVKVFFELMSFSPAFPTSLIEAALTFAPDLAPPVSTSSGFSEMIRSTKLVAATVLKTASLLDPVDRLFFQNTIHSVCASFLRRSSLLYGSLILSPDENKINEKKLNNIRVDDTPESSLDLISVAQCPRFRLLPVSDSSDATPSTIPLRFSSNEADREGIARSPSASPTPSVWGAIGDLFA
eukprot:TRINITY_DN5814_c0_g1_i1.p1 TRINITY_DN5814_c0_g1~~TRINITY_DN5814_c0_g1_i1.p1  ORF type:complete len:465 (+),score=48.55 TRINITY_DN5814_c0_g1_i1:553-1947(+)